MTGSVLGTGYCMVNKTDTVVPCWTFESLGHRDDKINNQIHMWLKCYKFYKVEGKGTMREKNRKNLLQREKGRWFFKWYVKNKMEPAMQRRCSGDSWSVSFILILIWNLNMRGNTIMKYSFNQNQTIPKEKSDSFLPVSLQKFHSFVGSVINSPGVFYSYPIIPHLWKNTNSKALALERMNRLTLK